MIGFGDDRLLLFAGTRSQQECAQEYGRETFQHFFHNMKLAKIE